jgi:LysM domain-containing protein
MFFLQDNSSYLRSCLKLPMAMKKILIATLLNIIIGGGMLAQPHLLMIQGEPGKFYVEHIVDAKENWYSVGRMYNISPKEIAPFNGTTISKPLEVGQKMKIPLTATNFSQNGQKADDETLVPIYHTIEPKEWLYHISTTYSKVSVATIEKWNHITGDQAKAGMQLIVSYLKVKTSQSPLAEGVKSQPVAMPPAPVAVKKDSTKPAVTSNAISNTPLKEDGASKKQSSAAPSGNKLENATSAGTTAAMTVSNVSKSVAHGSGGFFESEYQPESKKLSGQASTFKSTSGWQDRKYYALMNNVAVGTIVQITSPATNKTVYAKVLGQLPDMKESTGLVIRISNAAAAEMGAGEGKFAVDLKY